MNAKPRDPLTPNPSPARGRGEALRFFRFITLLVVALVAFIAPTNAQDDRDALIRETKAALEVIRLDIERDRIGDAAAVEERLRALRDSSRERLEPVDREIERVEADRAALGPAPGENDPPESEALQSERARLNARLAQLKGQDIQINANILDATNLMSALSSARVRTIYSRALKRGRSLASPRLWAEGASSGADVAGNIGGYFSQWTEEKARSGGLFAPVAVIAVALALLIFLFGPVHRWVTQSFASRIERFEPTRSRRIVVAGLNMLAHAAPGLVGGFVVFEALRTQGLIMEAGEEVARVAWFALVAFLLANGFVAGFFAPRDPKWRIAPVVAEQGRRAGAYLVAIVAIFGAKLVVAEIAIAAGAAQAVDRLIDGTSAVAIGLLLFFLCSPALWRIDATGAVEPAKDGAPKTPHGLWSLMRGAGRAVAGLTVLAPFAGYIDLADFVTSRIYYLSLVLAIAWFARALARQAAGWTAARLRGAQEGQTKEEASTFDLFWVNAAIDAVFALALIPALLILAGYHFAFVRDFISQAFFGFQIGGVQVPSLARILTAIAVFVGILALTRLVQRGLQRGPFAHSRVDPGVQNSLSTLAGYAGLIIASLLGVTALGFNLANLALIAGALSVGIGFGLQSTVNNFVSGLILLFERPIKVGDWVVTASGEGTVKRISVRSTEIETFDRASIIVPNSEMVSQTVTNWTHKNKIGRIAVRVGVSYAADPEQVREVLLKCARDHPLVVRYPEPFVVWKDFGASSLEFEIRCFLRDIGEGLGVRSDLRFAIFKAFKAAGIDMPFPQQDVYIKSTADGEIEKKPTPKKSTPDAAAPAPPLNEPEIAGDD